MCNILKKIITENFPNLEKDIPIQMQEASGHQTDQIKIAIKPIKVFHDRQKLKQYVTTKAPLQKILQGILHTESETQLNHEKTGSTKPQKKKNQECRE
jgi:hypothetical protein